MTYPFLQNYVCETKLLKQLLARESLQEMFIEYVNSLHLFDFWVLNISSFLLVDVLKAEKIEDQKTQTKVSERLLSPWDPPGKNIGVGCHSLLQGIILTQGLNSHLPQCRQILYYLSHYLHFKVLHATFTKTI